MGGEWPYNAAIRFRFTTLRRNPARHRTVRHRLTRRRHDYTDLAFDCQLRRPGRGEPRAHAMLKHLPSRAAVALFWLLHFLPLPILAFLGESLGTLLYQFGVRRRSPDGLQAWCRDCRREYQRAYAQVLHPVDAFFKRDADQPRQRADNGRH